MSFTSICNSFSVVLILSLSTSFNIIARTGRPGAAPCLADSTSSARVKASCMLWGASRRTSASAMASMKKSTAIMSRASSGHPSRDSWIAVQYLAISPAVTPLVAGCGFAVGNGRHVTGIGRQNVVPRPTPVWGTPVDVALAEIIERGEKKGELEESWPHLVHSTKRHDEARHHQVRYCQRDDQVVGHILQVALQQDGGDHEHVACNTHPTVPHQRSRTARSVPMTVLKKHLSSIAARKWVIGWKLMARRCAVFPTGVPAVGRGWLVGVAISGPAMVLGTFRLLTSFQLAALRTDIVLKWLLRAAKASSQVECHALIGERHSSMLLANDVMLVAVLLESVRLACSPPTKAIRVESPAGSLRIFTCGNRTGRCHLSAGFLGISHFPTLTFRRCSILTSITLIGSQGFDFNAVRTQSVSAKFAYEHSPDYTQPHAGGPSKWQSLNRWSAKGVWRNGRRGAVGIRICTVTNEVDVVGVLLLVNGSLGVAGIVDVSKVQEVAGLICNGVRSETSLGAKAAFGITCGSNMNIPVALNPDIAFLGISRGRSPYLLLGDDDHCCPSSMIPHSDHDIVWPCCWWSFVLKRLVGAPRQRKSFQVLASFHYKSKYARPTCPRKPAFGRSGVTSLTRPVVQNTIAGMPPYQNSAWAPDTTVRLSPLQTSDNGSATLVNFTWAWSGASIQIAPDIPEEAFPCLVLGEDDVISDIGETGELRVNPPTSGIIRHDSHLQKSGSFPVGDLTRFALVGGEQSNRSATADLSSGGTLISSGRGTYL
ncbi:hypothetical protein PR048_019987 [Dryococelus australis]|uniref:Uncharacterized protein n=1 Tax=Dryococelus australis TaxID=614101 RepID=A0ABQ9H509_9NEOP|nr:hypothetical protein PR048_019987 [Dryococelus australis]